MRAVLLMLLLCSSMVYAQSVEYKPMVQKWRFDNSKVFHKEPCKHLLDWSTYTESWDGKQAAIWGLFAASGVLHGAREAYHADPYVFEKLYGVHSESFWGSDAWKRNYHSNDPAQPHKHEYLGNFGRDIWHTAGFGSKSLLVVGTISIGVRDRIPKKYRLANTLLAWGLHSLFATLTYNTLRQ